MRRKLRTALALPRRDWWTLLQAWALLLAVDLGLRVLPFPRLQALAARTRGEPSRPEAEAAVIQRLERLVDVAARNHLYPMRCLRRSLVLQWLLGRRGIATTLRFGVQREADQLSAHAWLERAGQPIGEPHGAAARVAARFEPLATGDPNL